MTNAEKLSERRTSNGPIRNLSFVPKHGREISVEGSLPLHHKRNRTEAHSTTSDNTSSTERFTCSIFLFIFYIIDSFGFVSYNRYVNVLNESTYCQVQYFQINRKKVEYKRNTFQNKQIKCIVKIL